MSAVIGQVSKPFTSVLLYGNKFEFDFSWITRSGGFPSAHSSVSFDAFELYFPDLLSFIA